MDHAPHQSKEAAIALNNHGADLIERGDYNQALYYFSTALQQQHPSYTTLEGGLPRRSCITVQRKPSCVCAIDVWMEASTFYGCERQNHIMFAHAIRIPSWVSNPSTTSVAVAIGFNLAIAYHLASIMSHCSLSNDDPIVFGKITNKEQLMRQALRQYQQSFELQRTQASATQSPFFYMVCMNNIGVLFSDLGQRDESKECFHHLLSLLVSVGTVGAMDPSRFEFFWTYIIRITSDISYTIGAAAA